MARRIITLSAVLAGLFWLSQQNWLLFHVLIEAAAVLIGIVVFMIVWYSRRFAHVDAFIVQWGIACLFIAVIDVLHTVTYRGMGLVVEAAEVNVATQFWIAGRSMQAVALLVPLLLARRGGRAREVVRLGGEPEAGWMWLVMAAWAAVTALTIFCILAWRVFPTCWANGTLTSFKKTAEYVLAAAFAAGGVLVWWRRARFERQVWQMLLGFVGLTALSELVFTTYGDPYSASNTSGHLLRAAAYFCLYKAVVEVGLARPYDLLFRSLMQSRQELLELNRTLEARVAERTRLAEQRLGQVRELAARLGQTERRERRRLAGVLHDHLQQLLVAARMYLSVLRQKLSDQELQQQTARVDDLIGESIALSRSLTVELSPPVLQEEGLQAALRWLAQWMHDKYALEVNCRGGITEKGLSEDARNLAFEAARELLFNVAKHSGAKKAEIRLEEANGEIQLTVSDHGRGFEVEARQVTGEASGFGLANLRQRLELAGGTLEMDSAPGRGTRVTAKLKVGEALPSPAGERRCTARADST